LIKIYTIRYKLFTKIVIIAINKIEGIGIAELDFSEFSQVENPGLQTHPVPKTPEEQAPFALQLQALAQAAP